MAFLTDAALALMNFKHLGEGVLLSDKASIYNPGNISIGSHSRIDDFAILSAGEGGIEIGRYVHIACNASILGQGRVVLGDYSGISSRVAVYSSGDNYDGEWMTNPCLPETVRRTHHLGVHLGKHVVVGTGSTVLPGVVLKDGCAVGAMSLVTKSFDELSIVVGVPALFRRKRKDTIYELEKLLPE